MRDGGLREERAESEASEAREEWTRGRSSTPEIYLLQHDLRDGKAIDLLSKDSKPGFASHNACELVFSCLQAQEMEEMRNLLFPPELEELGFEGCMP